MKKLIRFGKYSLPTILLMCSVVFTSCSDDDNYTPPTGIAPNVMYGNYEGKMQTLMLQPNEEGEEPSVGTDVLAQIKNDTIYFESFPIRDIVVSIVGEELADKIVEAVGDIDYKIGYEASLNAENDSIRFQLNPKPLVLAVSIPSEDEPQTLNIEVKVSSSLSGVYEIASTNQQFKFNAEEVAFVNGDEKTPLDNFKPITFDFNMKKIKSE